MIVEPPGKWLTVRIFMMQKKSNRDVLYNSTSIVVVGTLIIIKFLISSRLPSYILADMPHDDGWLVTRTQNILSGNWLGLYDQYTLIKGVFSPLLLALSTNIGATFNGLNTAFYSFSCLLFAVAIRPVIRNQWLLLLLFAILLFNPITYALETGQRVYRNGIGQWQILLIFGCLIALFLRCNDNWKKQLGWAVTAGLAMGAFFETREDGTWIYPFVLGSLLLTIIYFGMEGRAKKKHAAVFFLPLLIAYCLHGMVMIKNYSYYGAMVVNDRSGGNYAKVAGDLHAISPDPSDEQLYTSPPFDDKYYNIYVSTMEKALAASPTLNSAADPIRQAVAMWGGWNEDNSGQLYTDHMLFALRDGVRAAGYYRSLPETEVFYGKVHEELREAFSDGTLVERGFPVSPLIKRIQRADLITAFSLLPTSIKNVAQFRDVNARTVSSTGSETRIRNVNLLAGGDYFIASEALNGSGWAFAGDTSVQAVASLHNESGVFISSMPFLFSEDVFIGTGSKFENAKMSRFSFRIEGYNLNSGVTMRFSDQSGNLLKEVPADASVAGGAKCGTTEPNFYYCIDNMSNEASSSEFFEKFVSRANLIIGAYKMFTPYLGVLACLAYVVATVMAISEVCGGLYSKTLPVWLILTGLGGSFLLFMFAMCIITATSFNSMTYLYLAPAYVLLLMFSLVSVFWGLEAADKLLKRGRA